MLSDEKQQELYSLKSSHEANQEMQINKQRDQQGTLNFFLSSPDQLPVPMSIKLIKKPVRNFSMENKKHIRILTAQNQAKTLAKSAEEPNRGLWLPGRYSNVESRVYQESLNSCPNQHQRKFDFLQSRSRVDNATSGLPLCYLSRPASSICPKSTHFEMAFPQKEQKNFVKINENAARIPKPVKGNVEFVNRTEGLLEKLNKLPKTQPGKVPLYLLKRQEDLKQRENDVKDAVEKAKIPSGCKLMDEEEKEVIITELQRSKAEKERDLFRLPLRSDTLRVRGRREELERTLSKLEEHLEILSKPKVYVPIDIGSNSNRTE